MAKGELSLDGRTQARKRMKKDQKQKPKGFYGVKDIKQGLLSKQDWVDLGKRKGVPKPRHKYKGTWIHQGRRCRDLGCLCVLLFYVLAMVAVVPFALLRGDLQELVRPLDMHGNRCGSDGTTLDTKNMSGCPVLFYPTIMTDVRTTYCMPECPNSGAQSFEDMVSIATTNAVQNSVASALGQSTMDPCWCDCRRSGATPPNTGCHCVDPSPPGLPTEEILGRCVPTQNITTAMLEAAFDTDYLEYAQDLVEQRQIILNGLWASTLAGFIYLYAIQLLTGFVVWTTMLATFFLSGIIFTLSTIHAGHLNLPDYVNELLRENIYLGHVLDLNVQKGLAYVCMGVSGTLVVILAGVMCVFRKRLAIAIGVIEESSKCFRTMGSLLLSPFITLAILVVVTSAFSGVGISILSMRDYDLVHREYVYSDEVKILGGFFAFGYLWILFFIHAIQYTTIAGAIADWYFTYHKDQISLWPKCKWGPKGLEMKGNDKSTRNIVSKNKGENHYFKLASSLCRTLSYHLGSLAFGSFLIAVVVSIRLIVHYVAYKVREAFPESKIVDILTRILECCVACFDRCIRFLSTMAYIQIAIHGKGFCQSAIDAFKLTTNNLARLTFTMAISSFIIVLGKIFIAVACALFAAWQVMNAGNYTRLDEALFTAPVFACVVIGLVVGEMFMSIFSIAVRTVLVCFCNDEAYHFKWDYAFYAKGTLLSILEESYDVGEADAHRKTLLRRQKMELQYKLRKGQLTGMGEEEMIKLRKEFKKEMRAQRKNLDQRTKEVLNVAAYSVKHMKKPQKFLRMTTILTDEDLVRLIEQKHRWLKTDEGMKETQSFVSSLVKVPTRASLTAIDEILHASKHNGRAGDGMQGIQLYDKIIAHADNRQGTKLDIKAVIKAKKGAGVRGHLAIKVSTASDVKEEDRDKNEALDIEVTVSHALLKWDPSDCDPYVILQLVEDDVITQTFRTGACDDTTNPAWTKDCTVIFNIKDRETATIVASVFDKDFGGRDDFIGEGSLPLSGYDSYFDHKDKDQSDVFMTLWKKKMLHDGKLTKTARQDVGSFGTSVLQLYIVFKDHHDAMLFKHTIQPAKKKIKDKLKRKKDRDFDDEAESEQFLWSSGTEMSCEYLDFAKFKHGTDVKKELDDLREAVVASQQQEMHRKIESVMPSQLENEDDPLLESDLIVVRNPIDELESSPRSSATDKKVSRLQNMGSFLSPRMRAGVGVSGPSDRFKAGDGSQDELGVLSPQADRQSNDE